MPARKKVTSAKKSVPSKNTTRKTPSRQRATRSALRAVSSKGVESAYQTYQMSYAKNPRLWVGVAVVVVAFLLFTFKGLFVAALVNGQPISRASVVSMLEAQNGRQTLDNLVAETLIQQEAQKRHVTVSQSDIDSQMKKIDAQLKAQGMTLDSALAARGMTKTDLTNQLKLQLLLNKMVGTSVKVTDDNVQSYIDKNQDSLPQNMSDDDLRKQVRTQLEQQQLTQKTQAFVADLQKKAKITYFVNY